MVRQGLLLGEVHLFWAEEHLHQVICLYPVLQGKVFSEGPHLFDAASKRAMALLPQGLWGPPPSQQA